MLTLGETLAHPSLLRTLVNRILEIIRQGQLGAGEQLPPARELALHFQVSIPTVREALRALESAGAVDIRHGSGVYVGPNISRVVVPNVYATDMSAVLATQLLDARLLIEPTIAAQAAANATAEDTARLHEVLAEAKREAVASGPDRPSIRNFHRELAAATGNVVLFEIIDSLLVARRQEQQAIRRDFVRRGPDLMEHASILEAVEQGQAAEALRRMQAHLEGVRDAVHRGLELARVAGSDR